jgi:hypothetical protein
MSQSVKKKFTAVCISAIFSFSILSALGAPVYNTFASQYASYPSSWQKSAPPLFGNNKGLNSNGTIIINQYNPVPLPTNTSSRYLPATFFLNSTKIASQSTTDPQTPCTAEGGDWTPVGCNNGDLYQSVSMYDNVTNHTYDVRPTQFQVSVSFGWTNPSAALGSGNWLSGGISMITPNNNYGSVDIGYNFYVFINNSGFVGVAWWIIAACEWPPNCGWLPPTTYEILSSNYFTIPTAHASDTVTIDIYWSAQHNGFVFDWKDPDCIEHSYCGNFFITSLIYTPPSWGAHTFYYGIDISCPGDYGFPCNPPYEESFASQLGITSNQYPLSNTNWEVIFSNPWYRIGSGTYYPHHALTMGAQEGENANNIPLGDAYWQDNWAWGGAFPWFDQFTVVAQTRIDSLVANAQTNGQTFTATGPYRTVCVTLTNFGALQKDADNGGDGGSQPSGFIAQHPTGDGRWWNVFNSGACSSDYITWTYSNYLVPDNSQLW